MTYFEERVRASQGHVMQAMRETEERDRLNADWQSELWLREFEQRKRERGPFGWLYWLKRKVFG